MRTVRFLSRLVGLALLLLTLQSLQAQIGYNDPYTLTRKTTHIHHLSNGVTITQVSVAKEARDSSGRTYREIPPLLPLLQKGQTPRTLYMVSDPVNHLSISWDTHLKIAYVSHWPDPIPTPQTAPSVASQPTKIPKASPSQTATAQTDSAESWKIIDLGTKTINGVEAMGTRRIKTIPAGIVGNDQPLTITTESWHSYQLQTSVHSTFDDPRSGVTTVDVTDIQPGEPDPILFQVPEGYTVTEQFQGQQN